MKTHEVFGVSTKILEPSYVNRGDLDAKIVSLLERNTHIALRGESKCGKSWLRQRNLPDAIVVQCRLHKSVINLFEDALSQLGLRLNVSQSSGGSLSANLEASTEVGTSMLAKIKTKLGITSTNSESSTTVAVGETLENLKFVADVILASERRLVIEDFHYLPPKERRAFATDLKALWDYGVYVVVIGIWSENNLLLHLNSDLAGRVEELSIYWQSNDLKAVLEKGGEALSIQFSSSLRNSLIENSFQTVGILQKLALSTLDESGITEQSSHELKVSDGDAFEASALGYADQLNALYQTFAQRVAKGVRKRKDSTGIYAHMLKVVMEASDDQLTRGLHTDEIFRIANGRESRIQKPNLRQILRKIDELQVDEEGRGLIITYDEAKDEVAIVDKQLLLYRKWSTVHWPWEAIIDEASANSFEGN